jgi:hypothetical protein
MQAGLVSKRLALSNIFAAFRLTPRVLVAVVETCAAALPRLSRPHEQRTAACWCFFSSVCAGVSKVRWDFARGGVARGGALTGVCANATPLTSSTATTPTTPRRADVEFWACLKTAQTVSAGWSATQES